MSTKAKLLRLLEDNQDTHLSGQVLANKLGLSRNSVWKAVTALRAEGYGIEAITNKGYRLAQENDLLSPQSIQRNLPKGNPFAITVRKSVGSTNIEARRRGIEGAPEGTVIVAEGQTAGRGQRGRTFFSPPSTGLYLSILLRPTLDAGKGQLLTCAAAVACAEAIEEVTGVTADIKWVNDVYCEGKKVAGILTEGVIDMESGRFEHVVCGIGINVRAPANGFPADLGDTAGFLCEKSDGSVRSALAAEVLQRFWKTYQNLDDEQVYRSYRSRCFLLGQPILLSNGAGQMRARAVDLTPDFQLVVQLANGQRKQLRFGEVACAE